MAWPQERIHFMYKVLYYTQSYQVYIIERTNNVKHNSKTGRQIKKITIYTITNNMLQQTIDFLLKNGL